MTQNQMQIPLKKLKIPVVYGGFWRRVLAFIIDTFILEFVSGLLSLPFFKGDFGALSPIMGFFITFLSFFYFTLMQSSSYRATVGSMTLGLVVVSKDFHQLSWGRAVLRYLLNFLNIFTFGLSYLLIAFHPKKKGIHDLLAKTAVIFKDPRPQGALESDYEEVK